MDLGQVWGRGQRLANNLRKDFSDAATLFDDLHPPPADGRHQRGTFESHRHPAGAFGLAEGARAEGRIAGLPLAGRMAGWRPDVLGDEEGVALSVTELVEDGGAETSVLGDALDQRLALAPVAAQVLAFGDDQGVFAGFEDLLGFGRRPVVAVDQFHGRQQVLERRLTGQVAAVEGGDLRPTPAHLRADASVGLSVSRIRLVGRRTRPMRFGPAGRPAGRPVRTALIPAAGRRVGDERLVTGRLAVDGRR